MPNAALDINQLDSTQPIWDLIQKHRPKPDEVDMDTQRKIAKGNAVAEAFRLLIDAVGGSKGANIMERKEPANAVMGAVDKYYKAKDANKAEQSSWDKLELGAGLEALKTKGAQDYATQKQKEGQAFATSERVAGEAARSTEAGLNRQLAEAKLKQESDQFKQTFGLQTKAQEGKLSLDREKLSTTSDNKSYETAYANGTFKGFSITDESIGRTFGLPVTNIPQALAFMQDDPGVKEEIGMIRARYDNLGTTAEVNSMIAKAFKKLSPETQDKLWALSSGSVPFTLRSTEQPAQSSSPLLSPFPYEPGKGPLMAPQTPTIKTDKKSTMVQVEQPAQAQGLTPEELNYIAKIAKGKKTPQQKAEEAYQYALKQGYVEESATAIGENLFKVLTAN